MTSQTTLCRNFGGKGGGPTFEGGVLAGHYDNTYSIMINDLLSSVVPIFTFYIYTKYRETSYIARL